MRTTDNETTAPGTLGLKSRWLPKGAAGLWEGHVMGLEWSLQREREVCLETWFEASITRLMQTF